MFVLPGAQISVIFFPGAQASDVCSPGSSICAPGSTNKRHLCSRQVHGEKQGKKSVNNIKAKKLHLCTNHERRKPNAHKTHHVRVHEVGLVDCYYCVATHVLHYICVCVCVCVYIYT